MPSIGSSRSDFSGLRRVDADQLAFRGFVFAATAILVVGIYVVVVVGLGRLLGGLDELDALLSIVATAAVAVGFRPLLRHVERLTNRLVFGRRANPYEVLSDFTRRVAATSDGLLDDAARSLAEGTGANRVTIALTADGEPVEAAAWPANGVDEPDGGELVCFPIMDRDLTLGSLDLQLPNNRSLRAEDRRLATQLASTMGLALRNQRLTEGLEARVRELRDSRRTLVAVQDETRRRLERDLHDGAQQQLVALKVKLGLGRTMAEADGASATAEALANLSHEADTAVDAMRDFARGVHPPLLEAEGLTAAVTAQARRLPVPVTVHAEGIGRYDPEIEATAFYCINEALLNTVQHARSAGADVELIQSNGTLTFRVTDDGVGFDASMVHGPGLVTMAERLDALSGELHIESAPGAGTALSGSVPLVVELAT